MVKKSGDVSWRSAGDERKGTPIFWRHPGSSRQHQWYMAQRTHRTFFWRVGSRYHTKMVQLGSSSLSHQCLPLEDGVMGLLPRHTPNLAAKKTHFFQEVHCRPWKIWQFTAWSLNKLVHVFANYHQYSSLGPLIHPDLPCFHIPAMPQELGSYQKTMNHLKHPLTHSVGARLTHSTNSNSQLLWKFFTRNICSHSRSHFCHLSEGHRPIYLEDKVSSCKPHRGTKDLPFHSGRDWCLFLEILFFFSMVEVPFGSEFFCYNTRQRIPLGGWCL